MKFRIIGEDEIESPSGVKLRRISRENFIHSPDGNEVVIVKNFAWEPIPFQKHDSSPQSPQPKNNQGKRESPQKLGFRFVTLLADDEKDRAQAIACPVEDPRNPFHAEYLRLLKLSQDYENA